MPLQWTSDLEVGVHEIDDQHRDLFLKAAELASALNSQDQPDDERRERVEDAVAVLGTAVVKHFAAEEKLMTRLRWPEYVAHRDQHEDCIDDFARLKRSIETPVTTLIPAEQVNAQFLEWLVDHIRESDQPLAKFINTKLSAA